MMEEKETQGLSQENEAPPVKDAPEGAAAEKAEVVQAEQQPAQETVSEESAEPETKIPEPAEEVGKLRAENDGLKQRLLAAHVRAEAGALGVSEKALPYVMKLAALEKIDLNDAEGSAQAVKAAVERIVRDIPALAEEPVKGIGTGSPIKTFRNLGTDATFDQIRAGIRGQ